MVLIIIVLLSPLPRWCMLWFSIGRSWPRCSSMDQHQPNSKGSGAWPLKACVE